jgi:cobalamin biosynthesis protein CbiG
MPPSKRGKFCLGLGLSATAEAVDAIALADAVIAQAGFDVADMVSIATIASRHDHPAALALASHFGTVLQTFDNAALEEETPRLANPSEALFLRIGCHGVAEAAALAAAGPDAVLLVEKTSGRRLTVAIAAPRH